MKTGRRIRFCLFMLSFAMAAPSAWAQPAETRDTDRPPPSGDSELAPSDSHMLAGETASPTATVSPAEAEPEQDKRGACDWYKSMGKLYTNPENPWLQELYVRGRLQYQAAYVDGKAGDDRFSYDRHEMRRLYVGAGLKALKVWEVGGQANIYRDTITSEGFRFEHMWDLTAKLDAKRAFDWSAMDSLKIGYGAREVHMSEEWNLSSTIIKTVERSAIANKIWPYNLESANPTGAFAEGAKGNLSSVFGIFSTTTNDWWAGWDDGELYYLKFLYDYSGYSKADRSELLWTGFYQDVDVGDEALAGGVEWSSSLSTRYGFDPWTVRVEGILGDNGSTTGDGAVQTEERRGSFWGFVVLPTVWLWQDKVEAVGRYQYQGSRESQGVRLYSRYARVADDDMSDISLPNGGRGDRHHSLYTGLNIYFCGDNAKVMFGVEYDDLKSESQDVFSGWTFSSAFRTFF